MTGIILQILAGLGIFLFGMACLESGIAGLSGRRMKRWVGRATGSGLSSAGFGALATAILQSSSMVALLALAFASAGWLFRQHREFLQNSSADIIALAVSLSSLEDEDLEDVLDGLKHRNNNHYEAMNEAFYQRSRAIREPEFGLSVQLNVNREIRHAHVNLLKALRRLHEVNRAAEPGPEAAASSS